MFPLTATSYRPDQKIWSGPDQKYLYNDQLTLGEVICMQLAKQPQKIIQIHDISKVNLTAKEFMNYAQILAKNMLKLSVKPGDIVGLYAKNSTHTATVMLAAFLCGTPIHALFPGFDKDNVQVLYKIKPTIIFCDVENYEITKKVSNDLKLCASIFLMNGELKGVPNVTCLLSTDEYENNENFRFPCVDLKGDDTAVILSSSGTTGTPKGVLSSHRALLNQTVFLTLNPDSVTFCFSPMYWASGLWTLTSSLVNPCLRIVTDKPFTPEYFLYLIDHYKITHIVSNAAHMAEVSMNESDENIQKCLSSIDTMVVAGTKIQRILQEKFNNILSINPKRPGFSVSYGMSELSGMLSFNGGYPCERREGSEGKLVANKKVRIINKNGDFLGPNEYGEILINSPYTWSGYYRNSEATEKALIDNWLHTGDIGFFDDDGFIHVCTRVNDVFKSRNFQIYPQLIEDIVTRIPGVSEACVFGIPDLVATNVTAGAVVKTNNDIGIKLTAQEIVSNVSANMGEIYHLTGGVHFVHRIPKTASGKVQRHKVINIINQETTNN